MIGVAALVVLAVLLWPGSGEEGRAGPTGPSRTVSRAMRRVRDVLRARSRRRSDWVGDLADISAVGLRAGLDLGAALRLAARSPGVRTAAPWLGDRAERALADGTSTADCLADPPAGTDPGAVSDLLVLARAWRLSESTGAPASDVTAAAAATVRSSAAARQRTASAVAGPRTSMRLLTALPPAGPVLGLLVGLDPLTLYGTPAARTALATGLLLTLGGWVVGARLVARAERPLHTDGRPR